MHMMVFVSVGLLAVTVLPAPASSQVPPPITRPNFSGEWALDLERSHLDKIFHDISSGSARIEHHEPSFSFSRDFTRSGKKSAVAFVLSTNGKEVSGKEDGMPTRGTLAWSGDTLVFVTIYQAPRGEARNTVRYTLRDSGNTLQAVESFHGPRLSYENVWVFFKRK